MLNNVNVKQCEKYDFYLRKGFHNVFGDKPIKWFIAQ
jgi:hypothetical protein